ncbi:hypothetical protein D3C84_805090 [compost metagenome]
MATSICGVITLIPAFWKLYWPPLVYSTEKVRFGAKLSCTAMRARYWVSLSFSSFSQSAPLDSSAVASTLSRSSDSSASLIGSGKVINASASSPALYSGLSRTISTVPGTALTPSPVTEWPIAPRVRPCSSLSVRL